VTRLTDEELHELSDEHQPDDDGRGIVRCRATSDDACAWGEHWPCRTRRLIDEVLQQRAAGGDGCLIAEHSSTY
jgi:hypothetical protein